MAPSSFMRPGRGFDPSAIITSGCVARWCSQVAPCSAASAAGLRPNDVIVAIDGNPIPTAAAPTADVAGRHPGEMSRCISCGPAPSNVAQLTLTVFGRPGGRCLDLHGHRVTLLLLGGHSTMAATAIQPTTTVSFRASGSKPLPVQVFVKAGQKWIVASEVCRILGIRTDSVPLLIPEQDRSRAAVLTKGSVQSVTTITEAGFNLLVAQSAKPAAKALREWMVGEVLPSIPRPPAPKVPVGQGDFF